MSADGIFIMELKVILKNPKETRMLCILGGLFYIIYLLVQETLIRIRKQMIYSVRFTVLVSYFARHSKVNVLRRQILR